MSLNFSNNNAEQCPAETTLKLISGRWKLLILISVFDGIKRFGQLQKELEGISQKVLTQQLRELESDGLIHREVYPEIPPRVEYSLTAFGETLKPIILQMHQLGIEKDNEGRRQNL
jgi:DNA-binding HxlR family transcriptional regulator